MEALIGKAPLTVVRMDGGRRVHVPRGTLVPEGFDLEDAKRLCDEGYLDIVDVPDPDDDDLAPVTDPVTDPDDDPVTEAVDVAQLLKGCSVAEVLDAVGDDADLAAAVLAAEQATSRPRKGVLEGLQEAIAAAAQGEQ